MNLKIFFLACTVGVLLAFYFRSSTTDKPKIQSAVEVAVVPRAIKREKSPVQISENNRPVAEKTSESEESEPVVNYQVLENRAVAFGDVILGHLTDSSAPPKGQTISPKPKFWPSPIIPYVIDPEVPEPERILNALKYFNDNTVIKFVPLENVEDDAIAFQPGEEHCLSYLGKISGHQPILISDKCRAHEIMHEVMHALGFIHEHSRTDRDQFLEILWDNIEEKFLPQFEIVPPSFMDAFEDFPFDYKSIMLYKPEYFARDRTLVSMKSKTQENINPTEFTLSPGDLRKIQKFYGK